MKLIIASLLLVLIGCAGFRQVDNLDGHVENDLFVTVRDVLKHCLTDSAFVAVRDIPLINGPAVSAYAAGTTFGSNIVSFLTFNGVGRKVIVSDCSFDRWGLEVIIHEYVHHLDDLDRDGLGEFIDLGEFKHYYLLMSRDRRWAGVVSWVEGMCNYFVLPDWLGMGDLSEHVAYTAQFLVFRGGPDYMKFVFRKMLRLSYEKRVKYVDISGSEFVLTLED